MGINNLYKVIKEEAPGNIKTYHLTELTGYRVAVDISVFLYKYIRSAGQVRWMNTFILLLCKFKKYGIKAVCIFDGPNPPIEKKREQEERRANSGKIIHRMKECIRIRNKLQDDYIPYNLEIEEHLQDECRKLIGRPRGKTVIPNYEDAGSIVNSLNITIERLEKQSFPITSEHSEIALKIVRMLGLAGFKADGEAETLCCYLALQGKVDAVLTEDTDVLAYGAPFMLAFKEFKLHEEKMYGIHMDSVLEDMGMDMDEFRDLCIMLRCDYNKQHESILGYPPDGKKRKKAAKIGKVGSVCMIKEYRRLEEVEKHLVDASPLIYPRCREIFTDFSGLDKYLAVPYNKRPDFAALDEFIDEHSLTITTEHIGECWRPTKLIFEDESSEEVDDDDFETDGRILDE